VREYREKYPDKAVIYSADGERQFCWAALMSGGSLAALPADAGAKLLATAAQMKPVALPNRPEGVLALGDDKVGYLIYSASGDTQNVELPRGDSLQREKIDEHLLWLKK
jgi:hypothetical protein